MGGISIWQLLIVFGIIVLLFGTKKLRNMGGDLGSAVKGFKKAMTDEDKDNKQGEEDAEFDTKQVEQRSQEQSESQQDKKRDNV